MEKIKKFGNNARKDTHRNVEAKCYSHTKSYCGCFNCCAARETPYVSTMPEDGKHKTNKYNTPQLNTALGPLKQMKILQEHRPFQHKDISELTPRSKGVIVPKITQKLNFNAGQIVFKNLTPIHTIGNDDIARKDVKLHRKYNCNTSNKMPLPNLCDFVKPPSSLTQVVPEPSLELVFPDRNFDYSCYLRLFD